MNRKLARFLRRRGVTGPEIAEASEQGWLALLTVDRLLLPGRSEITTQDIARRAGIEPDISRRLWRALGFPDVPDDVPLFTEESVDAVRVLMGRLNSPFVTAEDPTESVVTQVRAVGTGLARIAEVLSDQITQAVLVGRDSGLDDEQIAAAMVDALDWKTISWLTDYALRLQVRAALWRKLALQRVEAGAELAVGFLDLVGYTALSQELDVDELGTLVTRFEALTRDTVAQLGGRVVKTIGDEVMYVADDPRCAAEIALRLTERTGGDELLPEARAGLALGAALAREGDYYGPVVNLAHRLVELARPGGVVTSEPMHAVLEGDPAFAWHRMRTRRIRDLGRVEMWDLRVGDRESTG